MRNDLATILDNLDDSQVELLSAVAFKLASVKTERWTGKINFEFNVTQGGLGAVRVDCSENIKLTKRRKIRSRGV